MNLARFEQDARRLGAVHKTERLNAISSAQRLVNDFIGEWNLLFEHVPLNSVVLHPQRSKCQNAVFASRGESKPASAAVEPWSFDTRPALSCAALSPGVIGR
jgi:hypothetical protein